jgi:hypothetical protein
MNIEEIISISIYKALRDKLVVDGWLPNIENFDIENDNIDVVETESISYENAKNQIKQTKGFCIEVFPFSSNQAKGLKSVPRIVLDIHHFLPGEIGLDTTTFYEKDEESGLYTRKKDIGVLSDLTFTIYAVGNSSTQIYIMNNIILSVLPYRGYIKRYNEDELKPYNNLFVDLIDKGKSNDLEEGVMERFFKYEIPDIQELESLILEGTVVPINEITLETGFEEHINEIED